MRARALLLACMGVAVTSSQSGSAQTSTAAQQAARQTAKVYVPNFDGLKRTERVTIDDQIFTVRLLVLSRSCRHEMKATFARPTRVNALQLA